MLSGPAWISACLLLFSCAGAAYGADPQSSPDGRWQIYAQRGKTGSELWLRDLRNTTTRALVRLPGDNGYAAWSPDSLFVAFCAQFRARRFITVSDLTGHSWLIAEINGECNTPVWSADAVWLAFTARTRYGDHDIFLASAGGTTHRNLSNSRDQDEQLTGWPVQLFNAARAAHQIPDRP